jgi:hypothetical protein
LTTLFWFLIAGYILTRKCIARRKEYNKTQLSALTDNSVSGSRRKYTCAIYKKDDVNIEPNQLKIYFALW